MLYIVFLLFLCCYESFFCVVKNKKKRLDLQKKSFSTPYVPQPIRLDPIVVNSNDKILNDEEDTFFIKTLFSDRSIYRVSNALQNEGKKLLELDQLNEQDVDKKEPINIYIGEKKFILYCDINAIKNQVNKENRDDVNSRVVQEVCQHCVEHIGYIFPLIIEPQRKVAREKDFLKKEDNGFFQKEKDRSIEFVLYNGDAFERSVVFMNDLKNKFTYIVFQNCFPKEILTKVLTIILYNIMKSEEKGKIDHFIKKDFFSKIFFYLYNIASGDFVENNMKIIRGIIDNVFNEFSVIDKFYAIRPQLLYFIIFLLSVEGGGVENILSKNFFDEKYFLDMVKSNFDAEVEFQLPYKNDIGGKNKVVSDTEKKEHDKSQKVFSMVKKYFV